LPSASVNTAGLDEATETTGSTGSTGASSSSGAIAAIAASVSASSEWRASSRVSCENPTSSNVSETSAIGAGPRDSEPAKITSSIALPRRCFALCSPMHQRIASTMLDLPQPLGPTMPVTPCSEAPIWMTARSQNDLKPMISTRLMRMS
jgi:hypothetical protein